MLLVLVLGCSMQPNTNPDTEWELLNGLNELVRDYEDWEQTPDWTGLRPSEGPHGPYVEIWWNDTAYETWLGQEREDMPPGAILMKQGYNNAAGSSHNTRTAMWKLDDGAWFWARWTGGEPVAGDLEMCTGCHAIDSQDSVMSETWCGRSSRC
jgi:hypothetical protein